MIEKDRLIVCLTGPFGSGCTHKVAEILKNDLKFKVFSLSDLIEEEAKKCNIEYEDNTKKREMLQDVGNEMRREEIEKGGNGGVLVRKALEKADTETKEGDCILLETIKNPCEIIELKKYSNAYIIAIEASYETRWKRLTQKYKGNQSQFNIENKRDINENIICYQPNKKGTPFHYGQEVQKCVDFADIILLNDEEFDDAEKEDLFKTNLQRLISLIKRPGSHSPKIMELLMNNAYCTSLLSDCLKRQVGAIIAKHDKSRESDNYYIISSGYNRVPKGDKSCERKYKECYKDARKRETFEKIKHCPLCGNKIQEDKHHRICSNPKCKYNKEENDFQKDYSYGKGLDVCRAVHAEENAILQTSYLGGPSLKDSVLYTTTFPCTLCAKQIINSGIRAVVYVEPYPMKDAEKMLRDAKVDLIRFEGVKAQAFYKLFKDYNK